MLPITIISLLSLVIPSRCFITGDEIDAIWLKRRRDMPRIREYTVVPNSCSPNVKITSLVNKVIGEVERVEALKAVIVNPLPKNERNSSGDFTKSDKIYMRQSLGAVPIDNKAKIGDEAGHILGYALGGPADRRNLFPQHSGSNRNLMEKHIFTEWVTFESTLRDYMSKNERGKIEYWVLFHFPSQSPTGRSRPDRDRPRDYEVNRPLKFDFYAKLFNDDNVAEFECGGFMSNSKDGFSISKTTSTVRPTPRRQKRQIRTTVRPTLTRSSTQKTTTKKLLAKDRCSALTRS